MKVGKTLLLVCLVLCFTVGGDEAQISPNSKPASYWRQRVAECADSPDKARKLYLEAIYAKQTKLVAQLFEEQYKQKPQSEVRAAAFAIAAQLAERYRQSSDEPDTAKLMQRGVRAVWTLVAPEEYFPGKSKIKPDPSRPKTRLADAWVAWGMYNNRYAWDDPIQAEAAFNKALVLDPKCAWAHFYKAENVHEPREDSYFNKNVDMARKHYRIAEQLEPEFHVLTVRGLGYMEAAADNYARAAKLLREYVRLWPDARKIEAVKRTIVQLEKP